MHLFRHYKGGLYDFIATAVLKESGEHLVIYKNKKEEIFARPYIMFFESVEVDGKIMPRFTRLQPSIQLQATIDANGEFTGEFSDSESLFSDLDYFESPIFALHTEEEVYLEIKKIDNQLSASRTRN